jgi:hypothetical protein
MSHQMKHPNVGSSNAARVNVTTARHCFTAPEPDGKMAARRVKTIDTSGRPTFAPSVSTAARDARPVRFPLAFDWTETPIGSPPRVPEVGRIQ